MIFLTWSPTYNQLLALAESSAQQSIRTHRKTYSSVISRGREERSVRAEIIPKWTEGQRWQWSRNSRSSSSRGESLNPSSRIQWIIHRRRRAVSRSVRPVLPLRTQDRDRQRAPERDAKNTIKTLEPLGLNQPLLLNQRVCFPPPRRVRASRESAWS